MAPRTVREPPRITSGKSATVAPSWRTSRSALSSSSRSTSRWGSRFRAMKSSRSRVCGEKQEPTIRRPAPAPMARERRMR
ncbi:hypothetical protein ACFPRL_28220 [Pseudoclavibacter helvolus]